MRSNEVDGEMPRARRCGSNEARDFAPDSCFIAAGYKGYSNQSPPPLVFNDDPEGVRRFLRIIDKCYICLLSDPNPV